MLTVTTYHAEITQTTCSIYMAGTKAKSAESSQKFINIYMITCDLVACKKEILG